MKSLLNLNNFSVRLLFGMIALVILTTLSAGLPAFWLTRSQSLRQAESQLINAQQATDSLLLAEKMRLENLAGLFAERPTLQRLARERDLSELPAYMESFQTQTQLDILLLCTPDFQSLAGNLPDPTCLSEVDPGFALLDGQPALLARQRITAEDNGELIGETVVGVWMDEPFLRQLAADTGVQQEILSTEGKRLSSSISSNMDETEANQPLLDMDRGRIISLGGQPYLIDQRFLLNEAGDGVFLSQVALPVEDLVSTENQARIVLAFSTGIVAFLGIIFGVWYIRQLFAPVRELTRAADQISRGDLLAPIPLIASPQEVSTLATALHKSQESMLDALQESSLARDWFDALIQSIVEGVVTLDEEGHITFFSQGAEELCGWNRAETLGKHIDEVFPIEQSSGSGFFESLPSEGMKNRITVLMRHGKTTVLAVTRASLVPPGFNEAQIALVLRDVTQEEALHSLRAYFLANISHEFLTPLSTLNASMEILLDPGETLSAQEMRELIQPGYLSLRTLQTLIDNLLASSTIEAGQFTLNRRQSEVNQIVGDAIRLARPLLDRRHQKITQKKPAALPEIYVDPERLTLALVNLLVNASKFSSIGQPIEIHVEYNKKALRFLVADRGPGIPSADRVNLFRRFVRLNSAPDEQYGIGLGLFVVKTTVEAHGGTVGIDDNPGGGSLIWFELPVSAVEFL